MKSEIAESSHLNLFEIQDCLIMPVKQDMYDDFLSQMQSSILEKLKKTEIIGVIVDISAVNIIDSVNFSALLKLCKMTLLLGKETVIVGFQPGVASALTEFADLELNKLVTFISIKSAINYLKEKAMKLKRVTPINEDEIAKKTGNDSD